MIGGCTDVETNQGVATPEPTPTAVRLYRLGPTPDRTEARSPDRNGTSLDEPTPTSSPVATPLVPDVPRVTAPAEARQEGSPAPTVVASEGHIHAGASPIHEAFLAGYHFGGGDPQYEEHLIDVVQCESSWHLNGPGPHLGLAQFEAGTWEQAKCSPDSDYTDAWEQGCAVARWMAMIPGRWGTTAGWPNCWHVWN